LTLTPVIPGVPKYNFLDKTFQNFKGHARLSERLYVLLHMKGKQSLWTLHFHTNISEVRCCDVLQHLPQPLDMVQIVCNCNCRCELKSLTLAFITSASDRRWKVANSRIDMVGTTEMRTLWGLSRLPSIKNHVNSLENEDRLEASPQAGQVYMTQSVKRSTLQNVGRVLFITTIVLQPLHEKSTCSLKKRYSREY
jgi:hypothetical protein